MSEPVWVSDAMMDREILQTYTTEVFHKLLSDPPQANQELRKRVNILLSEYKRGKYVLDSDLISQEVTLDAAYEEDMVPLPVFRNDYTFISREVRTVLEEFDLGKTAFKDVTLINPFAGTRYEGYSILNVCEVWDAVDVEKSEGLSPRSFSSAYHLDATENDKIAVRQSDVGGTDLWMDLTIYGAFFISDRLHSALKKAALFQRPRFLRCKMV